MEKSDKGEMREHPQGEKREPVVFRLYIAGNTPHSLRAIANLKSICQEYLGEDGYQLEIVDVLDEPLRSLADGVLVTPTLLKVSPAPGYRIVGDLSDREQVLWTLGLEGIPPE